MEEIKKQKAIPSAFNIISSNRSIGYSFDAAIADIIDNSISAGASEIELFSPDGRQPCLKISDNGCGMDKDELTDAMTFGGKRNCEEDRDLTDLGRFGMGMKTASLSQCKRVEVISRKDGVLVGGAWDLDELKKNDGWEFLLLDENECLQELSGTFLDKSECSGTAVIWTKFDRLKESTQNQNDEFARLLDKATQKLELVFHRFLKGEKGLDPITITYNGIKLSPNDPFLSGRTPEISSPVIVDVNGSPVSIWSHKLLHPDKLSDAEKKRLCLGSTLLETQGFYIYRAKRLIDYGTWFGMASKLEKTKLSRIQIDIPNTLDSEWSLDIKKSRAIPPQVIRQELRNILENARTKSSSTFRPRKRSNGDIEPYWNREKKQGKDSKECRYSINKSHPLVKEFYERLGSNQLRETFSVLLSNLAKYFPFGQVEYDLQNDLDLADDKVAVLDDEKRAQIILLHEYGFTDSKIVESYPGLEDDVMKLLKELSDEQ